MLSLHCLRLQGITFNILIIRTATQEPPPKTGTIPLHVLAIHKEVTVAREVPVGDQSTPDVSMKGSDDLEKRPGAISMVSV